MGTPGWGGKCEERLRDIFCYFGLFFKRERFLVNISSLSISLLLFAGAVPTLMYTTLHREAFCY